jgi:hypothetical protein
MISESRAPFLRRSSAITCAALLPARGGVTGCVWAARFPLGAALPAVAFLLARAATGARVGACAPAVAGGAACGWVASSRCWMRAQMRRMAALRSVNFRTGVTPGRLFQISSSRLPGHALATSASSRSLLKVSKGVAVAAAASCAPSKRHNFVLLVNRKLRHCRFLLSRAVARSSHPSLFCDGIARPFCAATRASVSGHHAVFIGITCGASARGLLPSPGAPPHF